MKVGIDFGSTNSIIAYWDPHAQRVECFTPGGAGRPACVPSCVGWVRDQDEHVERTVFGREAQMVRNRDDTRVFDRFKLLLDAAEGMLRRFGYDEVFTARRAADEFLRSLASVFIREMNVNDGLRGLDVVVTIPHVWWREQRHGALEALEALCQDLGVRSWRFEQEPVAATAFFLKNFEAHEGRMFRGHVLLVDYGGGTLDLTLSSVGESGVIEPLEYAGVGSNAETTGQAGLAFDEAVLRRVTRAALGEELATTSYEFHALIRSFEESKIVQSENIATKIRRYLLADAEDREKLGRKELFRIDHRGTTLVFATEDLVEEFRRVNLPGLDATLASMAEMIRRRGIDTEDREKFRVVLVGGFNSFFMARHHIREFFLASEVDPRFDTGLSLADTALGIAKGAALLAAEQVRVKPVCPISAGIVVQERREGDIREADVSLIRKGDEIWVGMKPDFSVCRIAPPFRTSPELTRIVFFTGEGADRCVHPSNEYFCELFQDADQPGMDWGVAFTVDENRIVTFHTRSRSGKERSVSMGRLLEKYCQTACADKKGA